MILSFFFRPSLYIATLMIAWLHIWEKYFKKFVEEISRVIDICMTMLVLKLLSEKDMYGYEMIDTLRKKSQNVFELFSCD